MPLKPLLVLLGLELLTSSLDCTDIMSQSEFISQMDEMKKRGRKPMALAWMVTILLAAAGFYWALYYRPNASKTGVLVSGALYMVVWGVSCGVLVFYLRRHVAVYAPKCPACRKSLTWRERASVLADKQCPFCHAEIIHECGA